MAMAEKNIVGDLGREESDRGDSAKSYEQLSQDLKTLREDIQKDLKSLRRDFAEIGGTAAADARRRVKEGLTTAEEQTRAAVDSAASELHEIQLQAEKAVKKKPITAVAAALVIGYFVGGLARRS